ncbi:MAG: hypothetical protein ACYTGZ_10795 [Planctomycetota bacterium]|jgi:hypothetical protein
MIILNKRAIYVCAHPPGMAKAKASQSWVRIQGSPVLVKGDPKNCTIGGCPVPPPAKPCIKTLVDAAGHSGFVRIDGTRVCLNTVTGLTDGAPGGPYMVGSPGQAFVSASA